MDTTTTLASEERQSYGNVRIYVACLAAYNNGRLHGTWVDVYGGRTTEDDINEQVQAMLAQSPKHGAEEWEIHDTECVIGDVSKLSFADIVRLAELLEDRYEGLVKAAWTIASDIDQLIQLVNEQYCGSHESIEDYAEQLYRDCGGEIPAGLESHIDWASYAHDLTAGGSIVAVAGVGSEVYVFNNNY